MDPLFAQLGLNIGWSHANSLHPLCQQLLQLCIQVPVSLAELFDSFHYLKVPFVVNAVHLFDASVSFSFFPGDSLIKGFQLILDSIYFANT